MSQIFRFTSLAHHVTRERVQKNLSQIPKRSAAGVDGQTVEAAKGSFEEWIEPMLQSIHRGFKTRCRTWPHLDLDMIGHLAPAKIKG